MNGADGTAVGDSYRLITTLLDDRRYPAAVLIRLYHERWEIESAYLALRHTMLAGHVLRSGDRAGLEQEIWALLTLYQLLRMAMTTAVETRPGTNPDRASFTSALQTARDQLTAAAGVCPDPDEPVDLPGVIGRAVLATLLPARRARYSARKVKCATSRYLNRDDTRPTAPTTVTTIDIHMHTPPPVDPTRRTRSRHLPSQPRAPRPPTRRDRVTALLLSSPRRAWSGAELAENLQIPKHNMLTQLAEWTRLGFLTRSHAGTLHPRPATATATTTTTCPPFPGRLPGRLPIPTTAGAAQREAPGAQPARTTLRPDERRPHSLRSGKRHADPSHILDLTTESLTPRHCCARALRAPLDRRASAAPERAAACGQAGACPRGSRGAPGTATSVRHHLSPTPEAIVKPTTKTVLRPPVEPALDGTPLTFLSK